MKLAKILRYSFLTLILVVITYGAYMHQKVGGGKAPSIHALCPYGTLESLYSLVKSGSFIQKIYSGTLVMLIVTLVITLLFRKSFCGNICPLGTIQELIGNLGKKIFKKKFIIPKKADYYLRYLKYIVLAVTLIMAWKVNELWMAPYDPWAAYAHIFAGFDELLGEFIVGSIILVITLVGSLLYDRFFCKYLCPLGAFYGIIGKISPFKVSRNKDKCVDCGLCSKACPMNIEVDKLETVKSAECINCQKCVMSCKTEGSLDSKFANKKLKPIFSIILVMGIFFGSIYITQAIGIYKNLPENKAHVENITYGQVRGYMTIEEAAKATNSDLEKFYEVYEIDSKIPKDTVMTSVENFHSIKEKFEAEESLNKENEKNESENNTDVNIKGDDLKGWMSIEQAADTVGVSIDKFYELFEIPEDIPSHSIMRELDNIIPGYDFHKLKEKY